MTFIIRKVLIADDHPIMRMGVKTILNQIDSLKVIGEAEDGLEAWDMQLEMEADILVLDIDMPRMTGLELAKKVLSRFPNTHIILLTYQLSEEKLYKARRIGIRGILLKESALEDLPKCLEEIVAGRSYYSNEVQSANYFIEEIPSELPDFSRLSPTESSVVRLIADGLTTREIADRLAKSPKTVEKQRGSICKKFNLSGSNALISFVMEYRYALVEL